MRGKIISILKEIRPEFEFENESDFVEKGMLDSFDIVSLVTTLDQEFGISIDGTDILPENFSNVDKIEELLRKKGVK